MFDFKKDVVYYYDEMIGTYHYANNHPMKPLRVAMTDELVKCYSIDQKMQSIVIHFSSLGQSLCLTIWPTSQGGNTHHLPFRLVRRCDQKCQPWKQVQLRRSTLSVQLQGRLPCHGKIVWLCHELHHWLSCLCLPTLWRESEVWDQLVGRASSCQTILSFRFLLHQWLCFSNSLIVENLSKGSLHWHWYSPWRWSWRGLLSHR